MSPREAAELARRLRPRSGRARAGRGGEHPPRAVRARRSAGPRLRERGASDRQRPDDLAAAGRRPDARDARADADRPRARRRYGLGLPRGAAVAARRARLDTIERHRRPQRTAERAIADLGIDNVTFVVGRRLGRAARRRPRSTRSTSRRRPTRYPARSSGSSPTAAGWSRQSGPGEQHLVLVRRSGDRRSPAAARGGPVRPARPRHRRVASQQLTAGQAPRITSIATGLESTSTNRRPSAWHTAPSVPEPANGSRHHPPGRDDAATIRRSTPSGFWVG